MSLICFPDVFPPYPILFPRHGLVGLRIVVSIPSDFVVNEPVHEKTDNLGFRPGLV